MQGALVNSPVWEKKNPAAVVILLTALFPVAAANASFLISAIEGHVPWCFTYIDACTSISASGRHGTAYVVFKVLMLPACIAYMVFWHQLCGPSGAVALRGARLPGVIAAVFLVIYVLALGSEGDVYRLMRRYGVFVFFLGTLIAQIAAIYRFRQVELRGRGYLAHKVQVALLIAMVTLAVAEVPLGSFGMQDDQAENFIEWNFALLMQLWFLCWYWVPESELAAPASQAEQINSKVSN